MTALPLRLGPIDVGGHQLRRSGIRWLRPEGYVCRANEVVAYCDIALAGDHDEFSDESYDLQVALAPRVSGRLRHAPSISKGGYIDRLPLTGWREDTIWAVIQDPTGDAQAPNEPELLFVNGRRPSNVVEDRTGLLTGWHNRARAWWGKQGHVTILAAGTCEMDAFFRGDEGFFGELFHDLAGPVQVAFPQREPLVPSARILLEQLDRTPDQVETIREGIARDLLGEAPALCAEEWVFMGALLGTLERCPLRDEYDLLSRAGLSRGRPAAAVCLSLNAEMERMARHRRDGYSLNIHRYRLPELGPAVRAWMQRHFEIVRRTVDDMADDYRRLCAAAPDTSFFVVNRFSSRQHELIQSYHGLDDNALAGLAALHAKEANLMLHDLARELPNLAIVDADAVAAEVGMWPHVPDSTHGSGVFSSEVRRELLRQIHARSIPGFGLRAA